MEQTSIHIPVQIFSDFQSLEASDSRLFDAARKATREAYAPYSKFRVGVAVRLENGQIITGSNQEKREFSGGNLRRARDVIGRFCCISRYRSNGSGVDIYQ
ncbi:MAG: hypothetical protein WDM78_07195 [Puia sp.]